MYFKGLANAYHYTKSTIFYIQVLSQFTFDLVFDVQQLRKGTEQCNSNCPCYWASSAGGLDAAGV